MPSVPMPDWGPIQLQSRAPIFDNRISYTPTRVATLAASQMEFDVTYSHVNIWAQMPGYFFDGEWSRLSLHMQRGLGHGWEVGAAWTLLHRSGGYLDNFIESFHDLFGITQARRQNYPKNQLHVETFRRNPGIYLGQHDAGYGFGNPVLKFQKQLWRAARTPSAQAPTHEPQLSLQGAVKLPIGSISQSFASSRISVLANLALHAPLSTWAHVFVAYGLMLSPTIAQIYGMPLSEVQKFLMLSVLFRVTQRVNLLCQYLNQDGIVEVADFSPMERTTHEFALGLQWAPWRRQNTLLELALIENTVHDANTPDFGFHLGIRTQIQ